MDKFVQGYISGLRCLINLKLGSKSQIQKTISLFEALNDDDLHRLEIGEMSSDERIRDLAMKSQLTPVTCKNQLSNFLHWRSKSGNLLS